VIARLAEKGLDPTRFGDLTYPLAIAILTDGKAGEEADARVRARKALHDFRTGKIGMD
jgi:hypothetical protein